MEVPETVEFNGVTYRLMGTGRYYLSQSSTNAGRKGAKGLHVAVWEFYSGKKVPKGYEIHHKDGNPFNNDYSNLECIPRSEHIKKTNYKTKNVKKHLDEVRPLASEWHRSEEGREWHRQHGRECMEKREVLTLTCQYCGKEFTAKQPYAKFCSHNCSVKYDYHFRTKEETRVCEWCGKEFTTITAPGRDGARTCSRSCRMYLNHKRRKESGL